MADKPSDKQDVTKWSKTFGAHADPEGPLKKGMEGAKDFFVTPKGELTAKAGIPGLIGLVFGVMPLAFGAAFMYEKEERLVAPPSAIDTAVQESSIAFEVNSRNYLLVTSEDGVYRLYKDTGDGSLAFIPDSDDAHEIVSRAQIYTDYYVRGVESGDSDAYRLKGDILQFSDVSKVYGDAQTATRYFSEVSEVSFPLGESFLDSYKELSVQLEEARQTIVQGQYGFSADQTYETMGQGELKNFYELNERAEGVRDFGAKTLGGVAGFLMLGGIGAAGISATSAANRRRKKNKGLSPR